MNAIRKATEHKRKPPRPRVSEAGRRVLEWLAKHGPRYISEGEYRELWAASTLRDGSQIDEVLVTKTTIRELHNRDLIYVTVVDGISSEDCPLVGITDLGREVLRGAK